MTKGADLIRRIIAKQVDGRNVMPEVADRLKTINLKLPLRLIDEHIRTLESIPEPSLRQARIQDFENDVRRRYNRMIELAKNPDVPTEKLFEAWQKEPKSRRFTIRICGAYPCKHESLAA
jgi:hypothetical protein